MRSSIAIFAALASVTATPALAQEITGIWTAAGDRIAAKPARIAFPRSIAGFTLTETREYSHIGEKLDSSAEYRSVNGKVWATIYIYRPGYADAALAAFRTDLSMPIVYGSAIQQTSYGVGALGGRPGTAIRITYRGGVIQSQPLVSGSGFARIGGWIVKIRVSGPPDREREVVAALDAFLAAPTIDRDARLFAVAAPGPLIDCAPPPSGEVKVTAGDKGIANALAIALTVVALDDKPTGKDDLPPPFPANGTTKMCRRGMVMVGGSSYPVLAPAGDDKPGTIVVPINDSGNVIAITRNPVDASYTLIASQIGKVAVGGMLDRMPDNDQLAAIVAGKVPGALAIHATVATGADGKPAISINMPNGK